MTWRVRVALVLVLLVVGAAFAVSAYVKPYDDEGQPYLLGTHRDVGLPTCSFLLATRKPCPSCGLTTSFALLVRGDVKASWAANWVGTLMAVVLAVAIPWGLASMIRGRLLFFASLERGLTWFVAVFLTLLLARWGILFALDKLPTGG
jgi:hypothetical protein